MAFGFLFVQLLITAAGGVYTLLLKNGLFILAVETKYFILFAQLPQLRLKILQ